VVVENCQNGLNIYLMSGHRHYASPVNTTHSSRQITGITHQLHARILEKGIWNKILLHFLRESWMKM
jgi:hypothetical protein